MDIFAQEILKQHIFLVRMCSFVNSNVKKSEQVNFSMNKNFGEKRNNIKVELSYITN